MLFKRYNDPLSFLKTFRLSEVPDLILSLFDKEQEEELWTTWLHKEEESSFKEFKDRYYKKSRKTKPAATIKEDEQKNLDFAMRYIKPNNKGGGDH